MNPRERKLVIITMAVLLLGGVLYFMPEDALDSFGGGGSGALSAERQTFKKYTDALDNQKEIREAYELINWGQSTPAEGQLPKEHFGVELVKLLTEEFHISAPKIDTATEREIPDVEDYYFVEIPMHVEGSKQDMKQLLFDMDTRGVLIKSFSAESQPGRRGGEDFVTMEVEVARLVKHDEDSRERFKRLGLRGR